MHRRLLLLSALAAALPFSLHAEEKKEKKQERLPTPGPGERYIKLPPIPLELYDRYGGYHMAMIELIVHAAQEAKVSEKKLSDKIKMAFNVIPYEEYTKGNPSPMMKATALDIARKEYGDTLIRDVLIAKMLFR